MRAQISTTEAIQVATEGVIIMVMDSITTSTILKLANSIAGNKIIG